MPGLPCAGVRPCPDGDEVFRDLVLARIIEPTSKVDSLRVLAETGVEPPAYRTLKRRLPVLPNRTVRQSLPKACAAHARPGASLPGALRRLHSALRNRCWRWVPRAWVLQGTPPGPPDHPRSAHRRVGFPLTVAAFEGNKAETATMLPVIDAFKAAHHLDRRHRRRRCRHDLRSQPGRAAGCGVVVHPRRPHPVPARCGARMARQAPRRGGS